MTTGFVQRFKGKILASELWVTKGKYYDTTSGIAGSSVLAQRKSLPVTAAATTDYTMGIPPGAVILSAVVYTTTAYGAVTDNKVSIGSSAGGEQYVAQTSIKAIGVHALTLVDAQAATELAAPALSSGVNLYVRCTQTGTASATGAAYLLVEYSL